MVLTCTLGGSQRSHGFDRETLRELLIAALGCNVAGVIDAALYVMGSIFVRTATSRSCRRSDRPRRCRSCHRPAGSEPRFGALPSFDQDREQFYRRLRGFIVRSETRRSLVTADDLRSAVAVFILVARPRC